MGYDTACTLHLDGRRFRGTAWLEHRELIFRGETRLVIPLKDITSAIAGDGVMRVQFDDRTAAFHLGTRASQWAARITNPPSRVDKLGVKPGASVLLLGMNDAAFEVELAERGASVQKRAGSATVDLVFYGAAKREALDRLPRLIAAIAPAGAIWVVRRKGTPAISDADVIRAGRAAGLVDVKVVSFSETHSAEKLVIPVAKRSAAARPSSASPRRSGSSSSPGRR